MYDCIVVGSGFCGSIIARRLAEEKDRKVLVIEKRNHIAGNMFDQYDENNILIQMYGPHIFHTNNEEVLNYLKKFAEWTPFELKCRVVMDGKSTPSPFNFDTIDAFYDKEMGEKIKEHLLAHYNNAPKATIVEMLNSEDEVVKEYAQMLFDKDYSLYTAKQWGICPSEIDVSVLNRVPVLFSYKDEYFDDTYQCMPEGGFTKLFKKILDHPNITIELGCDALNRFKINTDTGKMIFDEQENEIPVVYTGPIDILLNNRFGSLPYRSLYFDYRKLNVDSYQDAPVVAYPQEPGYTRITEYKKLPVQDIPKKTTIAVEFPVAYNPKGEKGNEPYYPIPTDTNQAHYNNYLRDTNKIPNLFMCGRLADYKYYNMDKAVERAFEVFEKLIALYF